MKVFKKMACLLVAMALVCQVPFAAVASIASTRTYAGFVYTGFLTDAQIAQEEDFDKADWPIEIVNYSTFAVV